MFEDFACWFLVGGRAIYFPASNEYVKTYFSPLTIGRMKIPRSSLDVVIKRKNAFMKMNATNN